MKRLTTRSLATAEAIKNREPFKTSGSLYAEKYEPRPLNYLGRGYLSGLDAEALNRDLQIGLDYVVFSYFTPIGWHTVEGNWHVVAQTFSTTTAKHQGNLYLVGGNRPRPYRKWCGMKNGVNQGYDLVIGMTIVGHADTRERADFLVRYISLNGAPTGTNMDGVAVP